MGLEEKTVKKSPRSESVRSELEQARARWPLKSKPVSVAVAPFWGGNAEDECEDDGAYERLLFGLVHNGCKLVFPRLDVGATADLYVPAWLDALASADALIAGTGGNDTLNNDYYNPILVSYAAAKGIPTVLVDSEETPWLDDFPACPLVHLSYQSCPINEDSHPYGYGEVLFLLGLTAIPGVEDSSWCKECLELGLAEPPHGTKFKKGGKTFQERYVPRIDQVLDPLCPVVKKGPFFGAEHSDFIFRPLPPGEE